MSPQNEVGPSGWQINEKVKENARACPIEPVDTKDCLKIAVILSEF